MSDPLLPAWADELRARFQAGTSAFLVHGATDDLHPWEAPPAPTLWVELTELIRRFLSRTRPVITLRRDGRVEPPPAPEDARLRALLDLRRRARGLPPLEAWPESPRELLQTVRELAAERGARFALIIEDGASVAPPAGQGGAEADLIRGRLFDLLYDPAPGADLAVIICASAPTAVDARLASAGRVGQIHVPRADFRTLKAALAARPGGPPPDLDAAATALIGRTAREALAVPGTGQAPSGDVLPGWAQEVRERYLSGEAGLFLIHGNVRDVVPWTGGDGQTTWIPLREFLERFLSRQKDVVAYYNVSEGIEFPVAGMQARFLQAVNAARKARREGPVESLPRGADAVLPLLEDLITAPDGSPSAAVVLDYVETIVPMAEVGFMGEGDKANLVALQRWSSDPAFLDSDNVVVLCAEHLADVHRKVSSSPQLAAIQIPLPDEAARLAWLQAADLEGVKLEMDPGALAKVTAGLTLVQIRSLFRRAARSGEPITFRTVSRRKKAIIEQECHGLVEFVDPSHDFSHVGGMDRLKTDLMRVAKAIKSGQRARVPMGVIFVGPMGTGKTFLAEAFAAESGLTCIKFKNFREKWVGSTEGNLEKILQVVDGLGYVLLIIDEADRSMGSATDGDGGTSSRVIARLKEFMSDTSHRGRVVILMMTNRPDKLDADLKRPGRFDLKIPFFFPEEPGERRAVLEAVLRKNRLQIDEGADLDGAVTATAGYSAAELEAVMLAAGALASDAEREQITADDLAQAVRDVIPSRDTRMLEFMEMLAVFESTTRRMLPERYRGLGTDEVHARLDALRLQLGRRA